MQIKNNKSFGLDQEVSSHLAFITILILSALVAWGTVREAQKIIQNAQNSQLFDVSKRLDNMVEHK